MSISMDRWKDKVAVVTGASSGIGAAIAEHLVNSGLKVVGLARRKDRLDELEGKLKNQTGQFYPLKADMTQEEDIVNAFIWIKENLGPVHILINNAGIARNTTLMEGSTKDWKEVLDTNVLGLCIATREAVKDMKTNNVNGHIVHINSVLGHKVDGNALNMYPASKFAVTALTETLRQELNYNNSKIKITSISPGLVESEIRDVAGYTKDPEVKAAFDKAPQLKAADIADSVIYVLSTPPHVQIHEMIIKPVGETF